MPQVLPRDLIPGHSVPPPTYGPAVARTARRSDVDARSGQKKAAREARPRAKMRR